MEKISELLGCGGFFVMLLAASGIDAPDPKPAYVMFLLGAGICSVGLMLYYDFVEKKRK